MSLARAKNVRTAAGAAGVVEDMVAVAAAGVAAGAEEDATATVTKLRPRSIEGAPRALAVDLKPQSARPSRAGLVGCTLIWTMKEQNIEIEGKIQTVLPGTMFRVELDNKHLVLATISGKMRKRWVRLTVGDRVKMGMSPYDMDKARIVWRLQDQPAPAPQSNQS